MKKYLIAGIWALFMLQSCELFLPEDETPEPLEFVTVGLTERIDISDVEMVYSGGITEVALVARFYGRGGWGPTTNTDGEDMRVMVRGLEFDRENMMFALPADPPQELLRDIETDFPAGFTISDPEAQTISCVEIACDLTERNNEIHYYKFLHCYLDAGNSVYYELKYIYCDRSVTVTGSSIDWWNNPTTCDLSLERGWNVYVEKTDGTGIGTEKIRTVTHQMPVSIGWRSNMWIGDR